MSIELTPEFTNILTNVLKKKKGIVGCVDKLVFCVTSVNGDVYCFKAQFVSSINRRMCVMSDKFTLRLDTSKETIELISEVSKEDEMFILRSILEPFLSSGESNE